LLKTKANVGVCAQLESQLEAQETAHSQSQRSVRNVDRTVKDLQSQIERRDKQNTHLQEDVDRLRDKCDKLLKTIDELQGEESSRELTARRAERELREEREKTLRLEREVEGLKGMRETRGGTPGPSGSVLGSVMGSIMGRPGSRAGSGAGTGSVRRNGTWRTALGMGAGASEGGVAAGGEAGAFVDVPRRKSSIGKGRTPSLTKGFL
jgi:myosin protein heavy chain